MWCDWVDQQIARVRMKKKQFCVLAGISYTSVNPNYLWSPKMNNFIIVCETLTHLYREKEIEKITTEKEMVEKFEDLLLQALRNTEEYKKSIQSFKNV